MRKLSILSVVLALLIGIVVTSAQDDAVTCATTGIDLAGEVGTEMTISCPADCTENIIWGTDVYTNDSSVCTAAVHAGAITSAGGDVTLEFVEGLDEHPASDQNGVSSSSWGSWETSFTFVTDENIVELSCMDTNIPDATIGDVYQARCPAGCEAGALWGTNLYTDDSAICTAAAHAGATTLEAGGEFTLAFLEGREEYPASDQNGITSSSWGSWDRTVAISQALTCGQQFLDIGEVIGGTYVVTCPTGCDAGTIWGTDEYTYDSDLCTAAAHAGVISLEAGGTFMMTITEGMDDYAGTEQNGIVSDDWTTDWEASFIPEPITEEPMMSADAEVVDCTTNANAFDLDVGESMSFACPANCEPDTVWGTDVYTDDSSLCSAAIHAGAISQLEGGVFTVTMVEGLDEHPGTERNGISTSDWGSWSTSFTVE